MASQTGSIRFTPAAVAKTIGQMAAAAIKNTIEPSQVANMSTAIGIHARGLTIRRIWNGS